MNQKQYNKTSEQIKYEWELAKACGNMKRCEQILCNYERYLAWQCLQDMNKEYWLQIEQLNGVPIIRVALCQMSDDNIKEQIADIVRNIQIYFLIQKINEEINKRILGNK